MSAPQPPVPTPVRRLPTNRRGNGDAAQGNGGTGMAALRGRRGMRGSERQRTGEPPFTPSNPEQCLPPEPNQPGAHHNELLNRTNRVRPPARRQVGKWKWWNHQRRSIRTERTELFLREARGDSALLQTTATSGNARSGVLHATARLSSPTRYGNHGARAGAPCRVKVACGSAVPNAAEGMARGRKRQRTTNCRRCCATEQNRQGTPSRSSISAKRADANREAAKPM